MRGEALVDDFGNILAINAESEASYEGKQRQSESVADDHDPLERSRIVHFHVRKGVLRHHNAFESGDSRSEKSAQAFESQGKPRILEAVPASANLDNTKVKQGNRDVHKGGQSNNGEPRKALQLLDEAEDSRDSKHPQLNRELRKPQHFHHSGHDDVSVGDGKPELRGENGHVAETDALPPEDLLGNVSQRAEPMILHLSSILRATDLYVALSHSVCAGTQRHANQDDPKKSQGEPYFGKGSRQREAAESNDGLHDGHRRQEGREWLSRRRHIQGHTLASL
mmetsp:Transcript_1475/g.3492  ORF Transcript_1475/g.3492 Transcript_1475/m.3492 type:complete len:281 (+) Transcript_1475:530-1372(+)